MSRRDKPSGIWSYVDNFPTIQLVVSQVADWSLMVKPHARRHAD